nr:MAG TPA: hypothetical protein [Caudoviricetes sp.]
MLLFYFWLSLTVLILRMHMGFFIHCLTLKFFFDKIRVYK